MAVLKGAARWPLSLHLFESYGGNLLYTFPYPVNLIATDNEHGYESLTGFQPMPQPSAFWLYDIAPAKWMTLSCCGGIVWEGRLEDRALVRGGFQFTAFGAQRALSDTPYTGLWSTKSYQGWKVITGDQLVNRSPERYYMDNNNRLEIELLNGKVYNNNSHVGTLGFFHPHNASTQILEVEFSYDVFLDTNWKMFLISRPEGFGATTTECTVTGNGAQQTGSPTVTLAAGNPYLEMTVINQSGSNVTFSGADASRYAKITGLRVKGTTSTNVYADEIVKALLTALVALNPAQISAKVSGIQSPALDLTDAVWLDKTPAAILNDLVLRGDSQATPRVWEWGVWEKQQLFFRPRGSAAQTFYIDVDALELQSTLDTLYDQAYAVYQDANGRPLRTSVASDAESILKYTIKRRKMVGEQTTSLTKAQATRGTALDASKDLAPQASFTVNRLYDANGGSYPLWAVRSGDTVFIRNLPPTLNTDIDKIRSFRVVRKSFDVDNNTVTLTPEFELPTLAALVAGVA